MTKTNIFGDPIIGTKSKKGNNLFSGDLDISIKPQKKQKNIFDVEMGLGSSKKKTIEKDTERSFSISIQKRVFDNQKYKCFKCGRVVKSSHMQYHHKKPWSKGGKSTLENCIGLCYECHKDLHDDARIKESAKKKKVLKNNNLMGADLFGKPPKGSKKNVFGF
jgi:DNA-directed RNA polymerase subunit N (RpoN/RPB10)